MPQTRCPEPGAPQLRGLRFSLLLASLACLASISLSSAPAVDPLRAMRFQAQTPAEAKAWQEAARAKLFALLMGGGQPERIPLDAQVLHTFQVPASRSVFQELSIQTLPNRRVHAWLARPFTPKGKVGAVLALHGHGGSGGQIMRWRRNLLVWACAD